ncbi:MAG TPA: tripartite tricarboxylate transporter TctB family protein [Xanthobacteraceae bacterium]|nr:tripartite tricarboxylate transporter TctB family protein [Xanthobacteraceae bacterium]
MIRVKHPQDFWAGILFLTVGVIAAWVARNYVFGSATRMGPGYLPSVLSWMLIGLGVFLAARGLIEEGPALERSLFRPQAFIIVAIVVFGLLIERVGLVGSVIVSTVIAALASAEMRWKETIMLAIGLAILCAVLFVKLLGQPLELWNWGS